MIIQAAYLFQTIQRKFQFRLVEERIDIRFGQIEQRKIQRRLDPKV